MSRTKRDRSTIKFADDLHDGRIQKWSRHKHCMGHKKTGKLSLGPGGMNCNCCTKFTPDVLKVKTRRHDRRTFNFQELFDGAENTQG